MLYRQLHIVLICCLIFFDAAIARANTDVERGAKLAIKFCVRCHVVGENEFVGISSTMSFYMMSEHMDRYEPRLLTVTERRPHIALKLDIKDQDIKDLIAYIKQLDWRARWKRIMPKRK